MIVTKRKKDAEQKPDFGDTVTSAQVAFLLSGLASVIATSDWVAIQVDVPWKPNIVFVRESDVDGNRAFRCDFAKALALRDMAIRTSDGGRNTTYAYYKANDEMRRIIESLPTPDDEAVASARGCFADVLARLRLDIAPCRGGFEVVEAVAS